MSTKACRACGGKAAGIFCWKCYQTHNVIKKNKPVASRATAPYRVCYHAYVDGVFTPIAADTYFDLYYAVHNTLEGPALDKFLAWYTTTNQLTDLCEPSEPPQKWIDDADILTPREREIYDGIHWMITPPETDQKIMAYNFGMGYVHPHKAIFQQYAKEHGVTTQLVSLMYNKAIKKLGHK